MKPYISMLITALLACPVFAHAGKLVPLPEHPAALPIVLPDLASHMHRLEDYRGQVVLVNFWTTWCVPCLQEIPSMQHLQTALSGTPFTVLAINVKESREQAWRYLKMLDAHFTVLLDNDGAVAEDWTITLYPTSYLLDMAGNIRYRAYGAVDWGNAEARKIIETLQQTGQQPVQASTATTGPPTAR